MRSLHEWPARTDHMMLQASCASVYQATNAAVCCCTGNVILLTFTMRLGEDKSLDLAFISVANMALFKYMKISA